MKSTIVAFCFAIGLMLALPDPSPGSCSPPGQSSFVVEQIAIAPAMDCIQDYTVFFEFSQLAPVAIELQEKGGILIEKSLNTSLNIGYSNKNSIVTTTDFMLRPDYCLQTGKHACRPFKVKIPGQKIYSNNDPVKIRADTSV